MQRRNLHPVASCARHACAIRRLSKVGMFLFTAILFAVTAFGQVSNLTYHGDNLRTGLNASETLLTPANVNPIRFGKLFSYSVDGFIVGQPLYVQNVPISGQGTHNVVYVTTQHDSLYAFDADTPGSGAPLWKTSFINPSAGVTAVPISENGCPDVGYSEVGIMGTPVIDATTSTLYVSVKTKEMVGTTKTYVHRLHALDISSGAEKFGGPATIMGSYTSPGTTSAITFSPLNHNQRPALLLSNGTIYIAYGSNGCDTSAYGWIFAYNASNLQQISVFSPASSDETFGASIWQGGSGLASDSAGNVFLSTANPDLNAPTFDYADSIIQLQMGINGLGLSDYFSPNKADQDYMAANDKDLGSGGVLLLPDQPGPYPHLLVGAGKTGTIYLVNRDNMGGFNPVVDSNLQSLPGALNPLFGNPVYWNGMVYYFANGDKVKQFTLTNGSLSVAPTAQSIKYPSLGVPAVSSNGNTSGIVWLVQNGSASILTALDAIQLTQLYNSNNAGPRDTLGPAPRFITPTIVNGKVFVGTKTQLVAYGLFPTLSVTGGNGQTGQVATPLPVSLTVKASNPYSGNPIAGVTVNFSDAAKGGSFSSASAVTDSTGTATTIYTLPTKTGSIIVTGSSPGYASASFNLTAVAGPPTKLGLSSGGAQTGTVGTTLPLPVVVQLNDAYNNRVSGVPVAFSDGGVGGTFSATTVNTDVMGLASVNYTLPTRVSSVTITATAASLTLHVSEKATAGAPQTLAYVSGNKQTAAPNTLLPVALAVAVRDQYGNPIAGVTVNFSDGGAGGTVSSATAVTGSNGKASVTYTTPPNVGKVTVTATLPPLTPVLFNESVVQ